MLTYRKFSDQRTFLLTLNTDTCSTCNSLQTSLHLAVLEKGEVVQALLKEELESRKDLAIEGQTQMKECAKDIGEDTQLMCLDLQQTRLISCLSTNIAYCTRKV